MAPHDSVYVWWKLMIWLRRSHSWYGSTSNVLCARSFGVKETIGRRWGWGGQITSNGDNLLRSNLPLGDILLRGAGYFVTVVSYRGLTVKTWELKGLNSSSAFSIQACFLHKVQHTLHAEIGQYTVYPPARCWCSNIFFFRKTRETHESMVMSVKKRVRMDDEEELATFPTKKHGCFCSPWTSTVADLEFWKGGFRYAIIARVARLLGESGGMDPQKKKNLFDVWPSEIVSGVILGSNCKSWTTYY